MTILVTGATGNLGRLIIESLIERGASADQIVAGARDVAKAADLGVRAVHLDYTDPASVSAALDGVDSVVLVSSSEVGQRFAQHKAVIDAAAAAGVTKFVYTSAPKATTTDLILAPEHKATEEAIAASGLPSVILRNNWYTENYVRDLATAAESGVLAAGVGDGRVASASRKDFADAAAVVLLEDGHLGQVYELGGDVAWNYDELAAAFAEITGREVSYVRLGADEQVAALRAAGLDEGTAGFVAALDAGIRDGALADTDGTLARLIGRPTTPLVDGLRAAA
ncbi:MULTISPECIES: SDR family oxidoreductase [Microbacterium]|jgi:NAD(P)H dehydrogenase (quinone)|uniref:SDR family oxidoreductase n=1 Tax=Microbacterium TaxID=33882 RepID=UPI000CFA8EAF|nr:MULTISPECIES: SDR family oxidoreductase [unclassified Microbacterium]PRB11910.1 NAD(P)-dependent oxidoreductase [Microbacterium sp. MYb72]